METQSHTVPSISSLLTDNVDSTNISNNTKISVIIPTLNAERELPNLLTSLHTQKQKPDEIIVIDSESNDHTVDICKQDQSVKLLQIKRKDFDHGRTRDMAFRNAIGDIVVFLTQDALPANEDFLGKLIEPLLISSASQVYPQHKLREQEEQEEPHGIIAISTGRQLPKSDATRTEQLIRTFNYPAISYIRSKADIPTMGIKTFFCSDVAAAYRRDVYLALGGFDYPIKTNEDMFFAAKAINVGYRIAYVAEAKIFHSHNLSLREQYRRNYVIGYEIERHKDILNKILGLNREVARLVTYVSKGLLKHGHVINWLLFVFDCVSRLFGNKMGQKKYKQEVKRHTRL